MELLTRLENINYSVKQLKLQCQELEVENALLKSQIVELKRKIANQVLDIRNLGETKKISKLAEGVATRPDNAELKGQIDQLIKEINSCLTLVKI